MTSEELSRISTEAMLAALAEAKKDQAGYRASDFGRRARAWERLADAAEALRALTEGDERVGAGVPVEPVAV